MTDNGKKLDVICLGEPMLEFNQQPDYKFAQGFGGDTSNCAISAARQGARVGYLTRVGNDRFGQHFLDLWRDEGIDTAQVKVDPMAATGIYFVSHDSDGHHFTYYRQHSAAAAMQPADLSADYIGKARFLHVSAISQAISTSATDTVNEAIRLANESGTTVAYDTNLRLNLWPAERAQQVVHQAIQQCQIALPSYDDATVLTRLHDPDAIVDFYLALGPKIVVLKMGEKGAIVATTGKRHVIAGHTVNSIDMNAAGDTFAGAFLAELSCGADMRTAAEYANAAAALSTCSAGAVTSIPYRAGVRALLDKQAD